MGVAEPESPGVIAASSAHDAGAAAVAGLRLGADAHFFDCVDSTNDMARALALDGAVDGTLVVAQQQRHGRGRRRRPWRSDAGGLYLSLVLRPERPAEGYAAAVQLGAAVAVAEALSPWLPTTPELLWPNDVLCRGQKLAGILAESEMTGEHLDTLVLGIGVNVKQPAAAFAGPLHGKAASIAMVAGESPSLTDVLVALLRCLDHWECAARDGRMDRVCSRWMSFAESTSRDSIVEVETAAGVVRGRATGLSSRGGLMIECESGVREIVAGELIKVRRRT